MQLVPRMELLFCSLYTIWFESHLRRQGGGLIGNQALVLSQSIDAHLQREVFQSKALGEVDGTRLTGLDLVKPALSHSELGGAASEVVLINK